METRANYILVGAFTLAGFIGMLLFFLWFARVELDRQFAYYDVRFPTVAGLTRASDVRFSGLPVGQVVNVGLSPDGDGTVLVRIEIEAGTPVRTDSVATIEAQGVTGVSFVAISAGAPGLPLLAEVSDRDIPEIEAGLSFLQTLTEDAPEVLTEVLRAIRQLSEFLGEENQSRVETILANLEVSSDVFAEALDGFAQVSESVAAAAAGIGAFADGLDEITAVGTQTMEAAETTLNSLTSLADRTQRTLEDGDAAIDAITGAFESASLFMRDDLPVLMSEFTATSTALRVEVLDTADAIRAELETVTEGARGLIASYTELGDVATVRLTEAEGTLAAADGVLARMQETLATLDSAVGRVDGLLAGDGAALLAEARAAVTGAGEALAALRTLAETDVPATLDEIRTASDTANRVITETGAGLPDLVATVEKTALGLRTDIEALTADARALIATYAETGSVATARLTEAAGTLAAADTALARLKETLDTVDSAVGRVDGLLAGDGAALLAEARAAVTGAGEALAALRTLAETDVPATLDEIRTASDTANRVITETGAEIPDLIARVEAATAALQADLSVLSADARGLIATFSETGTVATARLTEAEGTLTAADDVLARLEETLATVDSAAGRVDVLLAGDGAALLAEARTAVSGVNEAIATIAGFAETDLPAIIADVRRASETASRVIAEVGDEMTGATGRVGSLAEEAEALLGAATATFDDASVTLSAVNDALTAGERTLAAAERAFDGADRVIGEDVPGITAQLRQTLARLDEALANVSDDVPAVTADLRSAAAAANTAMTDLSAMIGASEAPLRDFASSGLPQYTRLAQETRGLIASLERLARQIEREPARFFLNRQTPEFRR